MWRNVTIALVALMFSFAAFGQRAVQVRVEGGEQGESLVAAYVHVFTKSSKQPVLTVMTDEYGLATVDVNDSTSFIEVTSIGYAPVKFPLNPDVPNIKIKLTKTFSGLDEIVVTGLIAPVKLQNALSTYQVISKAAMQAQGAVTVKDALKNQLNINMGNDGVLGSKTSMQGMQGDKVKILIDGMPLNGREMGEIDLGQINLANVEKIEVVQGPMSVVYGTDALGGVINIITKKNSIPWRIEAGGYYETTGQYNFDVSGTYKFKKHHQFTLGGGRNFFQGWKPLDPLERSFLWKPKEQYVGNVGYTYAAKSSFRLQFSSDFVKEKVTNKDAHYKVTPFEAYGFDDYYRSMRLMNRLQLSGDLGKGKWQLQNAYNLYYRTRNMYRTDLVTLDKDLIAGGSQDTTRFDDVALRGSYINYLKKLSYTVGYDVNLQRGNSTKVGTDIKGINDYAVYLSTTIPVFKEKLSIQPAVRYSYNSTYQVPLIPSLNLLYNASEALQLRMSYGRGFRAPSLKELYLQFIDMNHEVLGNPDLKAEDGHHYQLSGSWSPYRKGNNFLRLLLTGYYNDVYNQISLIQPDPMELFATYTNIGRMKNVIGTLQADGQWKRLYLQLGYSLTHMLNADSSVFATSQHATVTVQYFVPRLGASFSTFYKYTGKQARLVPTIDGGTSYSGVVDPYSFWDASVEKKFWKNRLQLTAGVKNILDIQASNVTAGPGSSVHNGSTPESQNIATGRSFFTSLRLTLQ